MKTTKKAALVAASSALLLGLTVAQTVNADTYTVQNGDSFFGIASQYGVDPYQLAAENGMTIWSTIVPGGSLEVSGATTAVEETTEASSSEVQLLIQMLLGIVTQLVNVHGVLKKLLYGEVTGGVMVAIGQEALLAKAMLLVRYLLLVRLYVGLMMVDIRYVGFVSQVG